MTQRFTFPRFLLLSMCLMHNYWHAQSFSIINKHSIARFSTLGGIHRLKQSAQNVNDVYPTASETISGRILTMPFNVLSEKIGGSGKAKLIWESIREGVEPFENELISDKAKTTLLKLSGGRLSINSAEVQHESLSHCGTRKLLLRMEDGLEIESVLIPSSKYDRTTLCVSTQIGCDRGCTFCMTGKMGLIRNLAPAEIISQVFHGKKTARVYDMPPLTNVVFMGMGDAGRNIQSVTEAVDCLVDRERMAMASSKICVSTVGPNPEIFSEIARLPGTIAWSLHSADDATRRRLVPSTRHSTVELRDGLLRAMQLRSLMRHRTLMIAVTLIDGVNDSLDSAKQLADFVRPMLAVTPKIALDLIPYNDIQVYGFKRPSKETVNAFQKKLREEGFFCSVRLTRGDEESSACGMLATKRVKSANAAI